jgi:hypothetical protein
MRKDTVSDSGARAVRAFPGVGGSALLLAVSGCLLLPAGGLVAAAAAVQPTSLLTGSQLLASGGDQVPSGGERRNHRLRIDIRGLPGDARARVRIAGPGKRNDRLVKSDRTVKGLAAGKYRIRPKTHTTRAGTAEPRWSTRTVHLGAKRRLLVRVRYDWRPAATAPTPKTTPTGPGPGARPGVRSLPVVLNGSQTPDLLGHPPGRVVGYRWEATQTRWSQQPVQVDERVTVDFGQYPGNNAIAGAAGSVYGGAATGVRSLQYADPGTFVGADPDQALDADDEIVFLADAAGHRAPDGVASPAGTTGSGQRIQVDDPRTGQSAFYYLFAATAAVDQSAGQDLVSYAFSLDSGDYRSTYRRAAGPNPEHSAVTTAHYRMGFSDRWFTDSLVVAGGTGVDVLDGHKNQFSFSTCGRSNATFRSAEGAFIANIDGPIRALRSYVGANSGPLTEQTIIMYPQSYEMTIDLRVHPIPGVMDFLDWSQAATGMVYRNSAMGSGVVIDGVPDTVPAAIPTWEYVSGPQGVVTWTSSNQSTIPSLARQQVYADTTAPSDAECWGDARYYGAAGQSVTSAIANTDPRIGAFDQLQSHRVMEFGPPGTDPLATAEAMTVPQSITVAPR